MYAKHGIAAVVHKVPKATQNAYLRCITQFQKHVKADKLEDLLIGSDNPKAMQQVVINYLLSERERGTSHSSRNVAYHAIKHFYEINDIVLNWKKIASFLGSDDRTTISRGYTLEEIKKLLAKADERERVIILTLASTGMRLGGLSELKIRHLKKIEDLYQFTVYELSKKERYITFCSAECAQAIDSYFDYRVRMGERLTHDAPFIRTAFDKYNPTKTASPSPLNLKGIQSVIFQLIYDSGLRGRGIVEGDKRHTRKEVMAVHGFRAFFDTQLTSIKKNPVVTSLLLGHDIGLKGAYFKPDAETLLGEYRRGMNALTINEENRLKIENKQLSQKVDDIQLLQAKMAKQEEELAAYRISTEEIMVEAAQVAEFYRKTKPLLDDIYNLKKPTLEGQGIVQKE
jgi:site-specific recombinase XerD